MTGRRSDNHSQATQRRVSSGFTVVEVIIVLAIAGLILIIIFEAIPALTRNSANGRRKQDVTAILQAVSHYELNNSANFPAGCGNGFAAKCKTGVNTSLLYYTDLSLYDATTNSVTVHPQLSGGNLAPVTNVNTVDVYDYENCSTTSTGAASGAGADYRDIVALYAVEASGGGAGQCEQL